MKIKKLKDIDVSGRLAFLRNDFNVPMDKQQRITDDTRIRESLPTIRFLLEKNCRIVCASHLGRPNGEIIPECSLRPVALRLGELLGKPIAFPGEVIGEKVEKAKKALRPGEILLLENLRFQPGEMKNDESFARELSKQVDVYIDDAFGAVHRAHASIEALPRLVKKAAAGLLLQKEIEYLSMAVENPPREYLLILGGAKVSDKIPLIENLLGKVHTILIGGAMAYTFLKAKGEEVGQSKIEPEYLEKCLQILEKADRLGVRIILPGDHIAAFSPEPQITLKITRAGETIPPEMMGLDIGPETIESFLKEIAAARLIVWNGPMGVFEVDTFAGGTMEIARAVAESGCTTIIGGGDSVAAVKQAGVAEKITHISTGGGASLEFLSGKTLPGIAVLKS